MFRMNRWLIAALVLSMGHAFPTWASEPPAAVGAGVGSTPPADSAATERRIAELIAQLGNNNYFVRQRAQDDLARLGPEAFDALNDALESEDLEVSARAWNLLRRIHVPWGRPDDPPEVARCLQNMSFPDSERWLDHVQQLVDLPGNVGIPALCRMVRFEQSAGLSKVIALEIVHRTQAGELPPAARTQVLLENLGRSRRPAAQWLRAFAQLREDPVAAVAQWSRYADAEQSMLRRAPQQTEPRVVVEMRQYEVLWLRKLGRPKEMLAAIRKRIDLEKGDTDSLMELVGWLSELKAWPQVDELADRFATRFAVNPLLLYVLAQSQRERGDATHAAETARRAYEMFPEATQEHLALHLAVSKQLWKRGMADWGERENRLIISRGGQQSLVARLSDIVLSEYLHDAGRDLDAAEVLQPLIEYAKTRPADDEIAGPRSVRETRSQMHLFYAFHWRAQHEPRKFRQALDASLEADPGNVDGLIAAYRLQNAEPGYHEKIVGMIRKTASELRSRITENSDDGFMENQYAWLVGNTEGDYDEAIRFSQRSVEMAPTEGGFYDTLAHCYFTKGDLDSAVKYQARAAEMEPHSGLIAQELGVFRKALEEKQKQASPAPPAGAAPAAPQPHPAPVPTAAPHPTP